MAEGPVRHLRTQTLDVTFEEPAWPDLASRSVLELGHARLVGLGVLEGGTVGGNPSVALRIDDADGVCVLLEMTLATYAAGALALAARYPDLFIGPFADVMRGRVGAAVDEATAPPSFPPGLRRVRWVRPDGVLLFQADYDPALGGPPVPAWPSGRPLGDYTVEDEPVA